jgi:hypothetical protein
VNDSSVVDESDTVTGVVAPIRTSAPAGIALPVIVTLVPPPAGTRVGLIEVSRYGPASG